MRKQALFILILAFAVFAGSHESYLHIISYDGSSTLTKTVDVSNSPDVFDDEKLELINQFCHESTFLNCGVDQNTRAIGVTEELKPGFHYSFASSEGMPDITYSVVIKKIPTGLFDSQFNRILVAANLTEMAYASTSILNLNNPEIVQTAERLRTSSSTITYEVRMPTDVASADAGNIMPVISGTSATFNLVDVMSEQSFMTVESRQFNAVQLGIVAMLIVMVALGIYFKMHGKKHTQVKGNK
ncbi:MAG: hypothetical protein ABIJ10_01410 [Candidatus Micrarchaeota archaeon]|nr:hypothetical protein [Candidatus Micrarchaeota archaeon]MBU1887136.1 hypothetical protein [Candidatus Micrarchaeota archaeon]